MRSWWYVKNRGGYVVLEYAWGASDAKRRAASRPGFDGDLEAWPKACVPFAAAEENRK